MILFDSFFYFIIELDEYNRLIYVIGIHYLQACFYFKYISFCVDLHLYYYFYINYMIYMLVIIQNHLN